MLPAVAGRAQFARAPTRLPRRGSIVVFVILLSLCVGVALGAGDARMSMVLKGLLVVSLATVALTIRPEALFLSWLFLAPFFQNSASVDPTGHRLLQAFYLLPSFVLLFTTLTQGSRPWRPSWIDVTPALYLVLLVASLALSGFVKPSLAVHQVYMSMGIGVIAYYFVVFGPANRLLVTRVLATLMISSLVLSGMAIFETFTGWNMWHDTSWHVGISRSVATLANPAVLGTFVGEAVVIATAVLVWGGPTNLRRLSAVTIALGLPAILLTYTRGSIVAVIVVGVLLLVVRRQTRVLGVVSLMFASLIVAASWSRIESTNVYQQRITNTENIQARVLLEDWSLKLAAKKPLFGYGYGSFDRVKNTANLGSDQVPLAFGIDNTSHNTYLTVLVESGLVGLALLFTSWVVICWRSLKALLAGTQTAWLFVAGLAVVAVYLLNAVTVDMRFFSFVPAVPWFVLGLLRRHQLSGGTVGFEL